MKKQYKVVNGTSYDERTNEKVIAVLESARINRTRVRVYYGNTETGVCFNDEYDILGYIGRSTGTSKIPLLIYNNNSYGGGGLLDHCILKVKESKGGRVLYQAANFKPSTFEIVPSDLPDYSHNVNIDGKLYSRHTSLKKAAALVKKLS
jgi:hypothetical protein